VGKREILLSNRKVDRPPVELKDLLGTIKKIDSETPTVVGIDLRASEVRPTGWSILEGDFAYTRLLKTDEQIIGETVRYDPDIISIDSPLGIPVGRCCMQDSCVCRAKGILRECERILWKRGVKVFPCLLPSMQKLTERGMRLAEEFRKRGYAVIESYPGAAQDIMRIPRKRSSLAELAQGLANFGLRGRFILEPCSHDELDAVTSALVGYFYLAGAYEALGDQREEQLIVPKVTVAY
jgi:predicted nuclease with RNAse H fold